MKSGHKALGVLLVMCGLMMNPYGVAWLFSNDGNITTPILKIGVIIADALFVLFGVTVWLVRNDRIAKLAVLFVSIFIGFFLSVGIDRFYGWFIIPESANLLFPAFSKADHNTSEFELEVHINNLGFRGANTTIPKKKKRVVFIGDSFTFGWGVGLEETWIKLLSNHYPNIEFLNLGQGGNHPGDYAQVAKKAVPLLKPDVVIVGILQGNDLHQLMRITEYEEINSSPSLSSEAESNIERYRRYLRMVYPNLTTRFPATANIQERWVLDANQILSELTDQQKAKYAESINAELKEWFENGKLNPSLIYESLHHPDMYMQVADTGSLLCKQGIIRMHDHLKEIQDLCNRTGATMLILGMPNRPYGFPKELNALSELGFAVDGCDTLDTRVTAELASMGLTAKLIQPTLIGHQKRLFYKYDGHWNADGNRIFAEELNKLLGQDSTWKHFLTSSNF